MCTEAKQFIVELSEGRSMEEVRAAMAGLMDTKPYIFSDFKGLSIARAVLTSLRAGMPPKTPPLLTINEDSEPAWHVTKGFVDGFGVNHLDDLPKSEVVKTLGVSLVTEIVSSRLDFTPEEMVYRTEHIAAPAVRLHFMLPDLVTAAN